MAERRDDATRGPQKPRFEMDDARACVAVGMLEGYRRAGRWPPAPLVLIVNVALAERAGVSFAPGDLRNSMREQYPSFDLDKPLHFAVDAWANPIRRQKP